MTTLWIPESARAKHLRCHLCKQSFPVSETSPEEMSEFARHVKACLKNGHEERINRRLEEVAENPFLTAQDSEKVDWHRRRRG